MSPARNWSKESHGKIEGKQFTALTLPPQLPETQLLLLLHASPALEPPTQTYSESSMSPAGNWNENLR
jgi:hypothetical protein